MEYVFDILQVVLLSVFSLLALFIVSRLGGKRQIAQMSMFDYINSITIGSIAAEMATNLEEWYKPFTGILVYGFIAWLVHVVSCKNYALRILISGKAIVLMENGTIYKNELGRCGIDLNEFLAQCRIAGYFDLNDLDSAVLETNGQISFLAKSAKKPATPEDMSLSPAPVSTWIDLVVDGKILRDNLKMSGKDDEWLTMQLKRQGISQIKDAFFATCDKYDNFFACKIKNSPQKGDSQNQ